MRDPSSNSTIGAGRRSAGGAPCTSSRDDDAPPPMVATTMLPDGGGVPCDYCAAQRALLHCAQHGSRLCLICDVPVHAATLCAHERAPLCDGCHAAAATARCGDHRASLCEHCALAAGCDAERHDRSPARSYTGFPDPADLARILCIDIPPVEVPPTPPQEPPDTWVPGLVNDVELHGGSISRSWDDEHTTMNEMPSSSLIETGGNFQKQAVAGDRVAAVAGGAPVAAGALLIGGGGEGDAAGLFTQDYSDLYNSLPEDPAGAGGLLDDWSLLNAPLANYLTVEPETAWWSSSSVYDDPWTLNPSPSYSSETVIQPSTDHAMESYLAGNNAAFRLSSSVMSTAANTDTSMMYQQLDLLAHDQPLPLQQGKTLNGDWLPPPQCKFFNSGLTMWPPDEFPSRHLGIDDEHHLARVALGSTAVLHQDQDAPLQQQQQQAASLVPVPVQGSSQDMEARTKMQEKREEAKQRYKDKKKNRRFGKQIMYLSRKVRADTRNRVKGRFAKVPSGSGGYGDDDLPTQHGHGDRNGDDHPTHS